MHLREMHFDDILHDLGYSDEAKQLGAVQLIEEDTSMIQEIVHCLYRDEFNAKLDHFLEMFRNFGLSEEGAQRATSLVGELGNNVYDHNLGNWPTNVAGSIIVAQNFITERRIEITVGDPGSGFYGSLKAAFPTITTDLEAIKLGLTGNTGRVGEARGNGLRLIQEWTIQNFSGEVMIHSGGGLAVVRRKGIEYKTANKILGTLAQFVINYA